MSGVVDGHNEAQESEHADDEKNLATGDASRADVIGAARDSAIVELDQAEEDKRERPPMEENIAKLQAAIVVEEEQATNSYKNKAREDSAATLPARGHLDLLSLSRARSGSRARRNRGHALLGRHGRRDRRPRIIVALC